MAKYKFRFHAHTWQDIEVDANDREQAFEIANDIYNSGKYEETPNNFENTNCEELTDIF